MISYFEHDLKTVEVLLIVADKTYGYGARLTSGLDMRGQSLDESARGQPL